MAMHKALKPFGWYPDGHTREALEIGDERDFGDATDGLVAAKMIAPVGVVVDVVAPVVEPVVVDLHEQHQVTEMAAEPVVEPATNNDQPARRGRGRK